MILNFPLPQTRHSISLAGSDKRFYLRSGDEIQYEPARSYKSGDLIVILGAGNQLELTQFQPDKYHKILGRVVSLFRRY